MSRALTLLTLLALMSLPFSVAYPDGIGESANSGCLCHGAADELTVVDILGLPETYESSTQYNLSLVIESNVERDSEAVENWGGFRLIVSSGEDLGSSTRVRGRLYTYECIGIELERYLGFTRRRFEDNQI